MGFSDYLGLAVACIFGVLGFYLADNQWAHNHGWLIPALWTACGLSALMAVLRNPSFRRRLLSSAGVKDTASGHASDHAHATAVGSIRDIGPGARVHIGAQINQSQPTPDLTRGRVLLDWQKTELLGQLTRFAGTKVIVLSHDRPESLAYAAQFVDALRECGWVVDGVFKVPPITEFEDLQVSRDNFIRDRQDVTTLRNTLANAGLKCRDAMTLDPKIPADVAVLWVGVQGPEWRRPEQRYPPVAFDPSWVKETPPSYWKTYIEPVSGKSS